MANIKSFFAAIGEFLTGFSYDAFGSRVVPDDVPFLEISPYKYEYHSCEFYCAYTIQLVPDGPKFMPFWDQNFRLCVEDTDGTIYRMKDDFKNS